MKSPFPLVKLPAEIDTTLYLIKEELKTRKLFNILQKAGLDDCYFQPHLDKLILATLGLDDGKDETFNTYTQIMDKRSHKITTDPDVIMKQTLKAYQELVLEKKKRK